jgi:DNA-nicking Smr family endonuclease
VVTVTTRSRKPPVVEPGDAELFRASVTDVKPLPQRGYVHLERKSPAPVPEQRLRDDREALKSSLNDPALHDPWPETGDELSYARPGFSPQTLRKLRRGYWVVQQELDLHGLTVAEARTELVAFLRLCTRRGWRCVRIVHGKGLRSPNREPVLKRHVAHWLVQREEILAYCQAPRADGGSGAVLVLLKAVARGS